MVRIFSLFIEEIFINLMGFLLFIEVTETDWHQKKLTRTFA
jgi:hypothetical protein